MATDPVREEAERLVAAAMAAVSMAARGLGRGPGGRAPGGPWSTGAAGGFATGSAECCVCPVCRVIAAMREPDVDLAERLASGAGDLAGGVTALLRAFSRRSHDEEDADDAWHAATAPPPAVPMAKKAIAKKAIAKKTVAKKTVAKKAVATKAAAEAPAEETRPTKAVKKAVKKAARKAAKKAAPRTAAGEMREDSG